MLLPCSRDETLDSNSRMSLLVTIFLMLVNIGNSERSNMPDAETMTAMDIWVLSSMGFLAAALLEYAMLMWFTFKPPGFLDRELYEDKLRMSILSNFKSKP